MQMKSAGFTLIELLVSITILVVLAAVGMPMLGQFVQNSRISSTSADLLSMINLARLEAIRRNTRVSFCGLADNKVCSTNKKFETAGWAVFQEANGSGSTSNKGASDASVLVRQQTIVSTGMLIRADFNVMTFTPSGIMTTDASLVGGGTIKVCRSNQAGTGCDTSHNVRCILISNSGSPSIMEPTVSASVALAGASGGCEW